MTNPSKVNFKVSSRTMRMLGRQNVSNQFVAINELIKNAYDADAPAVKVSFVKDEKLLEKIDMSAKTESKQNDPRSKNPEKIDKLKIIIDDNGSGMDIDAIVNRWLTIGTDYKEREPTSAKGRVRAGAKGIGRFALDRLGEIGVVTTFHDSDKPGNKVIIDWRKYDNNTLGFESIQHDVSEVENTEKITGTKIEIMELRDDWDLDSIKELYDDLIFLIPPIESYNSDFEIWLHSDEFPEINGKVQRLSKDIAEFELISKIDENNNIHHSITYRNLNTNHIDTTWEDVFPSDGLFKIPPACGPLEVNILFYIQPESNKINIELNTTQYRKYLKTFRGIRIYRDGFLVKPYGTKNNDWLDLNARKVRQNEGFRQAPVGDYRIGNYQIIGNVSISRKLNRHLEDRTNREGLIDNPAFKDLKKFIMHCIQTLEVERQLYAREINMEEIEKRQDIESIQKRVEAIKSVYKSKPQLIPPKYNQEEQDFKNKDSEINEQSDIEEASIIIDELIEVNEATLAIAKHKTNENVILRGLASIGIVSVMFAHEIKGDVLGVIMHLRKSSIYLKRNPIDVVEALKNIDQAQNSSVKMDEWGEFILQRIHSKRRKESKIDLKDTIVLLMDRLKGVLKLRNIEFQIESSEGNHIIDCVPLEIESVIVNMLSNAIKAIDRSNGSQRIIAVKIFIDDNSRTVLSFADSGTGVIMNGRELNQQESQIIFDPLISSNEEEGTGMGLSIVKQICDNNKWEIYVEPKSELGGAIFTVRI